MVAGGIKEQAEQCLKNIKAIIESVEHCIDDTVKINIQLKDIRYWRGKRGLYDIL